MYDPQIRDAVIKLVFECLRQLYAEEGAHEDKDDTWIMIEVTKLLRRRGITHQAQQKAQIHDSMLRSVLGELKARGLVLERVSRWTTGFIFVEHHQKTYYRLAKPPWKLAAPAAPQVHIDGVAVFGNVYGDINQFIHNDVDAQAVLAAVRHITDRSTLEAEVRRLTGENTRLQGKLGQRGLDVATFAMKVAAALLL